MQSVLHRSKALHLLGAAAALTGSLALGAVKATPAHASLYESWISSNSGGAYLRECASTNCALNPYLSWLDNGTIVYMGCWWDGDWATGNYSSNRWFQVSFPYSNHWGWVHSSLVTHQNPNTPKCSSGSGWG